MLLLRPPQRREWLTGTPADPRRLRTSSLGSGTLSQVLTWLSHLLYLFSRQSVGLRGPILPQLLTIASPWQQRPVWCSPSRQMPVSLMMRLTCPVSGCFFFCFVFFQSSTMLQCWRGVMGRNKLLGSRARSLPRLEKEGRSLIKSVFAHFNLTALRFVLA